MDVPAMQEQPKATLNITYGGWNGQLPDTVNYDSPDDIIRTVATESVRTGYVPGIPLDETADFTDFVIQRYDATGDVPENRIFLRPKTPFG